MTLEEFKANAIADAKPYSAVDVDVDVEKNWKAWLSAGLAQYDENYYRSDQYKLDKGAYLLEKDQGTAWMQVRRITSRCIAKATIASNHTCA
jgi:anti-sigma factor RsiW